MLKSSIQWKFHSSIVHPNTAEDCAEASFRMWQDKNIGREAAMADRVAVGVRSDDDRSLATGRSTVRTYAAGSG